MDIKATRRPVWPLLALVLLGASLSACDVIPPEYEKYWVQFQKEWKASMVILTGSPAATEPQPAESSSPKPQEFSSKDARDAKANAELLHEVYKVVYMREPKDRSEFGSLVDSMNQGASLEGMYNGFTHSNEYRKLEMATGGASPEALRTFGQELAIFEQEMPTRIEFDAQALQLLAAPADPDGEPRTPPTPIGTPRADGVTVIEYGKVPEPGVTPSVVPDSLVAPKDGSKIDTKVLADHYSQQFVGASIFTLKRVLGDEALRVVAAKKEYRGKLAAWYSKWVIRLDASGVDFGISQRNKPDEAFHYKWALSSSDDRINWEVLNRVHRVLNEANRQKQ